MTKYSDLEYLRLSKGDKFLYRLKCFFSGIPLFFKNLILAIASAFKKLGLAVAHEAADLVNTFKNGSVPTRVSYAVMGFGSFCRGQWLRGLLFLLMEIIFIGYMILAGGYWLGMLPSLGLQGPEQVATTVTSLRGGTNTVYTTVYHDNSFRILLYGVLTLFFIVAFIYTWRVNIRQNKINDQIIRSGKKIKSAGDDMRSLVDNSFHKTLLALPLTGILIFTVMPIIFMILVAFTNYDGTHNGFSNNLFHWMGLNNFNEMLNWSSGATSYAATFGEVLVWTLIWAFFATFTNYFLGMLVAMAINKKGIHFKKGWRTILVLTIAIPQFISLLYVSKMFARSGIVNNFLMDMGWIDQAHLIKFWEDPTLARITVIIINIWIGIPYLMLITTGILMNIPADLYESAKIDGASAWQQYTKITLPYMLFVMGPYLLTSFTGNMNNFNVIYLLTGGAPTNNASSAPGTVGYTDLLITWLFKITQGAESKYYLASVVGILVFVVVAVISLVVYNLLPSIKNEEDFQ
ncbi:MAG: sugar ABC transporter permease [Clostridiales bacterium]|nr:sugar ABC transporter permease [Clostridiales bacterium]